MRKLLFRFLLIGLFAMALLKINDEPSRNYGTQIASSVGNVRIDIPEVMETASQQLDKWSNAINAFVEDILKELGYETTLEQD